MTAAVPAERIDRDGYAVVPGVLDPSTLDGLVAAVERADREADPAALRRGQSLYGLRDLLGRVPEVRALAGSPAVRSLVVPVLGPGAFVVRGLWFDKTERANWNLPWHRDLTVAVKCRVDDPRYQAWTLKAGIHHARPPAEVLEGMLTVRLHLDDAGPENGPLRVIPGSHRLDGRELTDLGRWPDGVPPVDCVVARGDAVVMRPLILHASNASKAPGHRRVVHLEFAAAMLPGGAEWYDA